MNTNLTKKQFEVIKYIHDYRYSKGYSPTFAEIGDALGVSKVTISGHVMELIRKEVLIRLNKHDARSLRISPEYVMENDMKPMLLDAMRKIRSLMAENTEVYQIANEMIRKCS